MKRIKVVVIVASLTMLGGGIAAAPAHAASCGYQKYADGSVGPSVCPNGKPNAKVKKAYLKMTPSIMALSVSSTRKQVQAAVCADKKMTMTNPPLYDSIEYQAARFGWKRSVVNPVIHKLVNGQTC